MTTNSAVLESCRCCLELESAWTDVFATADGFQDRICDLLYDCAGILISEHDGFSRNICATCLCDLSSAARFRLRCQNSQEILQNERTASELQQTQKCEIPSESTIYNESLERVDYNIKSDCLVSDSKRSPSSVERKDSTAEIDRKVDVLEVNPSEANIKASVCAADFENFASLHSHFADRCDEDKLIEAPNSDDSTSVITNPPQANVCDETVDNSNALQQSRDIQEQLFECSVCEKGFKSRSKLKKHVASHSNVQPYECDICDKRFKLESSLRKHKLIHTDKRSHICEVCGKAFKTRVCLGRHKLTHLGRSYTCDICGKSYCNNFLLRNHKAEHTGNYLYSCEVCNKKFMVRSALHRHLTRHDRKKKTTESNKKRCNICGTEIENEEEHKCSPHKCNVCDEEFRTYYMYKLHMRSHSLILPFKCEICDKAFAQMYLRVEHERTHTGERPYKCGLCDRAFSSKSNVSRHRRIHTGERPHRCEICGKRFVTTGHLKNHQFHHTGKWPIQCGLCEKGFLREKRYEMHMRSRHATT